MVPNQLVIWSIVISEDVWICLKTAEDWIFLPDSARNPDFYVSGFVVMEFAS